MKKENIITAVLVGALALAACQRNDDLGDGLRRQVDISATIEGHAQGIRTRAAMNPDGSGTFENGDVLSLFYASTQKQPSDPDFKMPVIMDYTISSTKLYWEDVKKNSSPTTDNKYGFLAWYPKYAISTEELLEKKGMLDYDVAGAVDDAHRDLLVAKTTDVAYGKPVNLAFHHVMHKLTVNLKSGKYTAGQLAKAQVKLAGFKSHTKVLLGQQRSIVEEASGTGKYPTKEGASVSFIVAPQKLEENLPKLLIEIEGKELTFPMPKTLPGCENNPDNAPTLNSGKHLTLNLSIGSGQGGSDVVTLETGNISAWDDGDSYSGTATEEGGGASAEQFPDPNFKAYVLEKFDKDKDGKISTAEAEAVTEINVPIKEIADLTGIGLFTNLKKLMCGANRLTKLDVSKCSLLKELDCTSNVLTSLNISGCTRLESLECPYNNLAALNISNCTLLKLLLCYDNKLEKLDIGATEVLEFLGCGGQQENKKLTLTLGNDHNREKWKTEWKLFAYNMNVLPTDLPGGGASIEQFPDPKFKAYVLEKFDKDKDGKISTAEAEAVTEINVPIKEIADLTGIGLFTNLKKLICYDNELTKLDVSKCTKLEKLVCYNNKLTELDVSGCTLLKELYCYNNKLEKLDVSGCTLLEELRCYNNKLSELNVGTSKLWQLTCGAQKENRQLTLTLGNAHNREKWKTEWKNNAINKNVTATDEN